MSKRSHSSSSNKMMDFVFISLISVFMLIIPFYRGLFFRENYIPAIIFVSLNFAIFLIWKVKDKNSRVIDTYMDLSVLLLSVAYLISFFFAVNAKDAFDMFLLYCSYFMMYKLLSYLSTKDEKYKNIFLNIIIISTFVLSLTSILSMAGIVSINGVSMGKRLYGLYQYANTSASVLGVGMLLSINKLINEEDIKKSIIYQIVLTSLLSTFIFTLSRGGYLVFLGVLILNFLIVNTRAKLKMLISIIVSLLSNAILIYKFYSLAEEKMNDIMPQYIISIIICAAITYFIFLLKDKIKIRLSEKDFYMLLVSIAVISATVTIFLFTAKEPAVYRIEHQADEEESWKYKSISLYDLEPNSDYTVEFDVMASKESKYSYGLRIRSYSSTEEVTKVIDHFDAANMEFSHKKISFTTPEDSSRILVLLCNYESGSYTVFKNVEINDMNGFYAKSMEKLKYIPDIIAKRFTNISLETQNVSSRFFYSKDGLRIIKDYPIIGAGGGAWKNLYRQYQSVPYNTTEVHNFYVQYGIEVGLFGVTLLVIVFLLILLSAIKSIKEKSKYTYVYLAAILLLLHSVIDFNLSLPAVDYILWLLIGIVGSEGYLRIGKQIPQEYTKAGFLVFSILIMCMSTSIYYGQSLGNHAVDVVKKDKDIDKAIDILRKASSFDKFNGSYRVDISQLLASKYRTTKDSECVEEIDRQVLILQKYEPYNHQYTSALCNIYLTTGNSEKAEQIAERQLQDEPLVFRSYKLLVDLNYKIAKYYLDGQKYQDAVSYLEKIIDIDKSLSETNKKLKTPLKTTEDYPKIIKAVTNALEKIKTESN